MSHHALVRQLFAPPGAAGAPTRHLLAQAAAAHARLLGSMAAGDGRQLDGLCQTVGEYLRGSASAAEKRQVLDDPEFVEALHALAGSSAALAAWDAGVAAGCGAATAERAPSACGRLGNVALAVLLRRRRGWCGQIELASDEYGRVHLPFSDWTLVLPDERSGRQELFAHQKLMLELGAHEVEWLAGHDLRTLVRMPRKLFDAMFIENRPIATAAGIEWCGGGPRPRFQRAVRLGHSGIRFEAIAGDKCVDHAELTGGIVEILIAAMEQNAPGIYGQLCQCIRTIRGFELPGYAAGHIESFSVPTSPGIIGFNVSYTAGGEPRLSPYSFMCLGHELGHTMHYLIDDVAYLHGWRFVENPADMTPVIARYGRSLRVRTLFQIPYVHLFEWWLLILFLRERFAGLPWRNFDNTYAVGEDVRSEIEESFELLALHARVTQAGAAVVERLRELVDEADRQWREISRTNSA
jgi:hypothetical protein